MTARRLVFAAACLTAPCRADVTFFDNGEFALVGILNGGVLEPGIPLYLNGVRVNDPGTVGLDTFRIIDIYDRVPGTSSYPLTFADIIANGYVRPLVQFQNGLGSAVGTSVITGPSFRPAGQPLDLIPDMTRADVVTGGSARAAITGQGDYRGRAHLVSERRCPDPAVGQTLIEVEYTWTAMQDITLPAAVGVPGGRGFDAFRLVMLSSMLADLGLGRYDANYLAVTDPLGRRRTIALDRPSSAQYLYAAPQPTAVGRSFELLKDRQATWNPLSPSVRVEIVAVDGPAALPPPQLGVHAWHSSSTNPNDDSLNVWLEWLNAPLVIATGSQFQVRLDMIATPATDPGDLNHDEQIDCHDLQLFAPLVGLSFSSPTFDAYADLNRDGVISQADRVLLLAIAEPWPADFNQDGQLTIADFAAFQAAFVAGDPRCDFTGNGQLTIADFAAFQAAFAAGCP